MTKAGLAGAEATDGVEAILDFGAAAEAAGPEVLPLAPTVLQAPAEACVERHDKLRTKLSTNKGSYS